MSKLAEALFTKTQQRVLGLLYLSPDKSFYVKQILRQTGMGVATIKRELDRMVVAGILSMTKVGNQHHYQANPVCPIYTELISIVRKTLDEKDKLVIGETLEISRSGLKEIVQRYHIHRLGLFGSAARGELNANSDIDLLVEFEKGRAPSLGGMVKISDDFKVLFNGRQVDVVTPAILNNPYRKRVIETELEELYAA